MCVYPVPKLLFFLYSKAKGLDTRQMSIPINIPRWCFKFTAKKIILFYYNSSPWAKWLLHLSDWVIYARRLWLFYQHLSVPDIYGLLSKQFSGLAEMIEETSCLQKAINITLIVKAKKQAAANKQTKPKATHLKWFGVFHFSC